MENVPNPEPSSIPAPLTVSRRALGRPPSRALPGPRPSKEVGEEVWLRVDMRRALARRDIKTVYRILQKHGMSQRWIAARTEQSQSEVSEIVAGRRWVGGYDLLLRISLGLVLPRGWLGLAYDRETDDQFAPDGGGRTVTAIENWTGVEVKILRLARRMSVRAFAAHLGVSDRMVSKWEAGGANIRPREVNQEALDTSLAQCNLEEIRRFEKMQEKDPVARRQPATSVRWGLVVDLHPHDLRLVNSITLAVERVIQRYGYRETVE